MPLASASFQPAGEEELELLLAPGTVTGFKGVLEVKSGYYQAKLRNGSSFVSLPSSRSVLVAAWFYAKAFKARRADGVEFVELKESVSKVRARSLPTRRCLLLTNPCLIPSAGSSNGEGRTASGGQGGFAGTSLWQAEGKTSWPRSCTDCRCSFAFDGM